MKKYIILLLIFIGCHRGDQKMYNITGYVNGLSDGNAALCIMEKGHTEGYKKVLEVEVRDGKFNFRGKIKEPKPAAIMIYDTNSKLICGPTLWIENRNIRIEVDAKTKQQEISGSDLNNVAIKYKSFWNALNRPLAGEKEFKKVKNIIKKNPSSYYMLVGINELCGFITYRQLDELIKELSFDLNKYPLGIELLETKEIVKNIEIGKAAPAVRLQDTSNKISDINLKNNKYTLLEFWASWCGPCLQRLPEIQSLYKDYRTKGFEVIGISIDDNSKNWLRSLKKNNMIWPSYLDLINKEAKKKYCIKFIPQNYLLDKNGIIVAKNLSNNDLKVQLKKLLK